MEVIRNVSFFIGLFLAQSVLAADTKSVPAVKPSPSINLKVASSTTTPLPACSQANKSEGINILFEKFADLVEDKKLSIVVTDLSKCYVQGQKTKIFSIEEQFSITYKRTLRGEVQVLSAERVPFDVAKTKASLLLTDKEKIDLEDIISRRVDKDKTVWVLSLKTVSLLEENVQGGGVPPHHPQAETIQFKELKSAMDAGSVIFDSRPKELYDKGHLNGAVHVPFKDYKSLSSKISSISELKKESDRLPKGIFSKDKSLPVFIYSACAAEYSSYNTITLLRDQGYKNIKWFRGGMASRKNAEPCLTPATLSGVSVISANDLAEALNVEQSDQNRSVIFDLRNPSRKNNMNIVGTELLFFKQKLNPLELPVYRDPNMTPETLLAHKEKMLGFVLRKKDQPIILFGENEFDWAPYKAAVILKGMGFKTIRWYRNGMEDWKIHYLNDKKRFHIVPEPDIRKMDI